MHPGLNTLNSLLSRPLFSSLLTLALHTRRNTLITSKNSSSSSYKNLIDTPAWLAKKTSPNLAFIKLHWAKFPKRNPVLIRSSIKSGPPKIIVLVILLVLAKILTIHLTTKTFTLLKKRNLFWQTILQISSQAIQEPTFTQNFNNFDQKTVFHDSKQKEIMILSRKTSNKNRIKSHVSTKSLKNISLKTKSSKNKKTHQKTKNIAQLDMNWPAKLIISRELSTTLTTQKKPNFKKKPKSLPSSSKENSSTIWLTKTVTPVVLRICRKDPPSSPEWEKIMKTNWITINLLSNLIKTTWARQFPQKHQSITIRRTSPQKYHFLKSKTTSLSMNNSADRSKLRKRP